MDKHPLVSQEGYDPNRLLDALIQKLGLKNDAALSRALEVRPPVISKIRHRTLPVGASLLIRMHEVTDLSIRELRELTEKIKMAVAIHVDAVTRTQLVRKKLINRIFRLAGTAPEPVTYEFEGDVL